MHNKWSDVLMKWKGIALLILLSLLFHLPAKSQVSTPSVTYGFKQDTVVVNAGQTFSNLLWIENKSNNSVSLVEFLPRGQLKLGLLKLPDTIFLTAGQKKWFPIKYMADRQTIQKSLQDIQIKLEEVNQRVSVQEITVFYAKLDDVQRLTLETEQSEIYLDQASNQARIMLRCFNDGLVPIHFRLELTEIPDGLEFIGEKSVLTLEPGGQESLPFIAKNKLNSRAPADFSVTVRALDVGGGVITSKRLRIMNISSDRRLSLNPTPFAQDRPNMVALRYMTFDNSLSSYQLQGNGKYNLAEGTALTYQVNASYFNTPGQTGLNISDSFVDYQGKDWRIKAGTIYETLDFNLNGTGLKGTINLGEKQSLNLYGVSGNYMLYSDFNQINNGNTFAVSYKHEDGQPGNKNAVLLYDRNVITGVNTLLTSGLANFLLADKQVLGLETGYSLQRLRRGDAQNEGLALGLNYNLNLDKLNVFSRNYYSSPGYGGLRRGLLQFENQILIRFGQYDNVSFRHSYMRNQSKYFGDENLNFLGIENNYGTVIYELGYGTRLKNWSVNFRPYYFYQQMEVLNSGNWKSASLRVKVNLNYSNSFHDLYIDADNGYTFRNTSERPPAPFLSSRMNANYRNKYAGFSAYGQYNSYYLTDVLAMPVNSRYYSYSFGPNTRFTLFKQQAIISAGLLYNYFGFNKSRNYSVNSSAKWRLKGDWAVSADLFYSLSRQHAILGYNPAVGLEGQNQIDRQQYSQNTSSRQFRIGLEKQFGSSGNMDSKKLELLYFEDQNGNGYRDGNEPYVPGIVVKIDGLAAVTNAKGLVKFLGLKDKLYTVTIVNSMNWTVPEGTKVFLNKNISLEIPLIKMERLSGKLSYVSDKYSEGVPSSSGLRVKAIAGNGKIYSTLTNDEGTFSFYLPENKYNVYIETDGLPYAMINPKETVEVKRDQVVSLEFKYKYEGRKIDVVRFK